MDTWINTLPKGLYLSLSWVAYPLSTEGEGRDPKMTITRSGTRFMKGQTRFRGNPKSALQIVPASNTAAVAARVCRIAACTAPYIFSRKCFLIQGAVADYSSHILHRWFSVPSLLEMEIWSVTNDVGPSLTRWSPLAPPRRSPAYLLQLRSNYPCWIATPNHTWFWDALPLSPHLLAPHSAWFW